MMESLILSILAVAVAVPTAAHAQDAARNSDAATQVPKQKHVSSPNKVWTDDDVTSPRPVADVSVTKKESRAADRVAPPAPAKEGTASKPARSAAPPALSNPKTLDEADKMIAWENRDIEAQQEFVDRLQKELRQAPVAQRARLQKLLEERTQILADVRKEQQALVAQRKELEKTGPR